MRRAALRSIFKGSFAKARMPALGTRKNLPRKSIRATIA